MSANYTIREFGTIWNKKEFPGEQVDSFDCIYIEEKSFISLKNFIAENNDSAIEVDQAFSVHRKKGKDFIKVKNYVGVIETKEKTVIEILPKIYSQEFENKEDSQDFKKNCKSVLLSMLRYLKDSPFKSIDRAHLQSTRMPLIEIFITIFLAEFELLLKRGLKHFYVSQEGNEKSLKGKLKFAENIRFNLVHKERFYVEYDEFCANIPQNRLLKSTLQYLISVSRSAKNKSQIYNFMALLEDVEFSTNQERDWASINGHNRLFSHYVSVLNWARVFLKKESFASYKGKHLNMAILFPMERIFEDYVAAMFAKFISEDYTIRKQDKRKHLVESHNQNKKFRLKPDMVIEKNKQTYAILDTKWKIINQNSTKDNYCIKQADMYQLYAYGTKYDNQPELFLLYPENSNFTQELDSFEYFVGKLKLRVIPVPVTGKIEDIKMLTQELFN